MTAPASVVDPAGIVDPADLVAVWRIAVVQALRDAAVQLAGSVTAESHVHALRRGSKQLRALALLAPSSLEDLARETRDQADALRRSLGNSRDATVRRETFEHLARHLADSGGELTALLDTDADRAGPFVPDHLRERFSALAGEWDALDRHDVQTNMLVESLTRTYRRARKRRKRARGGDTQAMHRWRRAIVDLDLQTSVLANNAPRMVEIAKRAHKLRDLIGRLHDIDALADHLARSAGDTEALAAFREVADRERRRLARKASKEGKRLLRRKAGLWRDEVAALLYAAARTAEAASPKVQQASV